MRWGMYFLYRFNWCSFLLLRLFDCIFTDILPNLIILVLLSVRLRPISTIICYISMGMRHISTGVRHIPTGVRHIPMGVRYIPTEVRYKPSGMRH